MVAFINDRCNSVPAALWLRRLITLQEMQSTDVQQKSFYTVEIVEYKVLCQEKISQIGPQMKTNNFYELV